MLDTRSGDRRRWLLWIASIAIVFTLLPIVGFYYLPLGLSTADLSIRSWGSYGDTVYAIVESGQQTSGLRGLNTEHSLQYIMLFKLHEVERTRGDVFGPVLPENHSPEQCTSMPLVPNGLTIPDRGRATLALDDTGRFTLLIPGEGNRVDTRELDARAAPTRACWKPAIYPSSKEQLPPYSFQRVLSPSRRYCLQFDHQTIEGDDDDPVIRTSNSKAPGPPSTSKTRLYDLRTGQARKDPWIEEIYRRFGGGYSFHGARECLTDDLEYFVVMPQDRGTFSFGGSSYLSREYCVVFKRDSREGVVVRNAPEPFHHALSIRGELYFVGQEKGNLILLRRDGQSRIKGPEIPHWWAPGTIHDIQLDAKNDQIVVCKGDNESKCLQVLSWDLVTGKSQSRIINLQEYWVRRWNRYRPVDLIPITVE